MKYYEKTRAQLGYVTRVDATQKTYTELGFKCGLEVHQQLDTKKKLFCNCPTGFYQDFNNYDAEIVRHMRPTLSELGEYDGTALMEFRTKKNITYRIKNKTTCTYEIDDTPPFPLNREALAKAMELSVLLGQKIVGEVHIIRKQYLDGSIPAGFQRTAIIGIDGEIPLKNKKVRIIQLSLEEDSCREISDIGHERVYATDRLGMPLSETVTHPDMLNPDEAAEACEYIRFLARSSGQVRTGIGAAREDVNVSVTGGTRVEIKGVAHIKWIPELTHNEAFRQKSLLVIKDMLNKRFSSPDDFSMTHQIVSHDKFNINYQPYIDRISADDRLVIVNLPKFKGLVSFFTQPEKCYANELSDRLKVIACLEKPNLLHSEDDILPRPTVTAIARELNASADDAQLVFWAPAVDIPTALETIRERCELAFIGVPEETRKGLPDGTTLFERVLPGADRMYPDTDSAPIPITQEFIDNVSQNLAKPVAKRMQQLTDWGVPPDAHTYLLRNNLIPLIEDISNQLGFAAKFICIMFGHTLRHYETRVIPDAAFEYSRVYDLCKFVRASQLEQSIIKPLLGVLYKHPHLEFPALLEMIGYKKFSVAEIMKDIAGLREIFAKNCYNNTVSAEHKWVMGDLRHRALGNVPLDVLSKKIKEIIVGKESS